MCKGSGESVDHLLLHCEVVREVWNFILRSFGVSWVFPATVSELLFGWHNWWGKQSLFVWNLVPHCIMWTIWHARNGRTFEDMEHSVGKIIERVMGSLYDWSCAWGICSSHSLGDYLESLSLFFHLSCIIFCPVCILYAHGVSFNNNSFYLSKKRGSFSLEAYNFIFLFYFIIHPTNTCNLIYSDFSVVNYLY